jgi:hypothetical protein
MGTMMAKHKRRRAQLVADRLQRPAPSDEAFKTWLAKQAYSSTTIVELMRLLSCWSEQARSSAYDLSTTNAVLVASAQIFRGTRTARAPAGR